MARRRIRDPRLFGVEAAHACRRLLDRDPKNVDWPASRSRRSVLVRFEDGAVIATRRSRSERAQLEAHVMRVLHDGGAAVPRVLAFDGEWLIQEYLEGERLPHVLLNSDRGAARSALETAAHELARIHAIGRETGLVDQVVQLGRTDEWLAEFVNTPARIGEEIGVPASDLDVGALVEQLRISSPPLLKWDARPGNAVFLGDGRVAWFDWEHCGVRNALDDFAWLIADEFVPVLDDLTEIAVANAPAEMTADAARQYFTTYATFHTAVRLALVVRYREEDGEWWDEAMCLAQDKVRVTEAGTRALTARGEEFAACDPATRPLAGWFNAVAARLGAA